MKKPYTLRKTKAGLRMMTLSPYMEQRLMAAPPDAVRLTFDKVFNEIKQQTGGKVVLNPEQYDRLMPHLENQSSVGMDTLSGTLIWRWLIQGARYSDTKGMDHFLDVATEMVALLRTQAHPTSPA